MGNELKGTITRSVYNTKVKYGYVMVDDENPSFREVKERVYTSTVPLDSEKIRKLIKEDDGEDGCVILSAETISQVYGISWDTFMKYATPVKRYKSQIKNKEDN